MSFDWYKEVPHTEKIAQGDIFFGFPVPVIEAKEEHPFFKPRWTRKDVIVITQACDIEQKKVNEITFCPIMPVENAVADLLIDEQIKARDNTWRNSRKGPTGPIIIDFEEESTMKKVRKRVDAIRKGEYLPLHLLNETPEEFEGIRMGAKVVLLRDTYQLPLQSVLMLIHDQSTFPYRLRLLPPYREHLGQAFANVYSRIGLPRDIKANEIRLDNSIKEEFPYEPPKLEE